MTKTFHVAPIYRWGSFLLIMALALLTAPLRSFVFSFVVSFTAFIVWYHSIGSYSLQFDNEGITQGFGLHRTRRLLWSQALTGHLSLNRRGEISEVILRDSPGYHRFVRLQVSLLSKQHADAVIDMLYDKGVMQENQWPAMPRPNR